MKAPVIFTLLALGLFSAAHAEQLRVVNFAKDKGNIDVWIDGKPSQIGIFANQASSFKVVGAGRHNVTVFSASSKYAPVVFTIDTLAGMQHTLVLEGANPHLVPLVEAIAKNIPAGQVRVRVYNDSPSSHAINLPTLGISTLTSGQGSAVTLPLNYNWGIPVMEFNTSNQIGNFRQYLYTSVSFFMTERDNGSLYPVQEFKVVLE